MSITDELRKEVFYAPMEPDQRGRFIAIADHIDAEHQRAMAAAALIAGVPMTDEHMAEHGWVRLPKDADGETWHIGDRTESGQVVYKLYLDKHGWSFYGLVNDIDPAIHRHYHAPTVEDVLHEFICDHEEGVRDEVDLIAEYAAKLRLRGDAE